MVGNCVLWERSGEGGYIRLIRSTGVALYNRGGEGGVDEYNEGKRTLRQKGSMLLSKG